jgi:hypothetical protein
MLEPLLVECELASICFYGMARQLPPGLWRRFVAEIRSSATLRKELKAEGLGSTMERWKSQNQVDTK